ncbi:MAG: hypothetical protein HYZ54_07910 [Ignavibacteriae bacterium]|nr:hypothetical protein [Ignavibacteriota bacterium]
MNFTKLLFQKHTLSFVGLNTVFLVLLSLSACSSKVRSNVVTYGLNSCFKLNTGELVVNSDKYAEKFYKDHCEINGLPLASQRGVDFGCIILSIIMNNSNVPLS